MESRVPGSQALVTAFASIDQYIVLFYVCFCLISPCLAHIVDMCPVLWTQSSCLNQVYLIYICIKTHDSLFALKNMQQYFITILRDCFKKWCHQQHTKSVSDLTLGRLWKAHLFTAWEPNTRVSSYLTLSGACVLVDSNFSPYEHGHVWMTLKIPQGLFWD